MSQPRAEFVREMRAWATVGEWNGTLADTTPEIESLYEQIPSVPKAFLREVLLRPIVNARFAGYSRRIAREVSETCERRPCLPPDIAEDLAHGSKEPSRWTRLSKAHVTRTVQGEWLGVLHQEAQLLLTREVLRRAGTASPADTPPCPDWNVVSRELGGGRVRVSIQGSLRETPPWWPECPITDFEFTRR